MIMLLTNHISILYIRPINNIYSHTKYTYIIDQEYSHMVLLYYANISHIHKCMRECTHPKVQFYTILFLAIET